MILSTPCIAWASSILSTTAQNDVPEDRLGLRLLAPAEDLRGTDATVVVQTFRVRDQSPMPHVPVDIDVHMNDGGVPDRHLGSFAVVTDHRGTASVRFNLPRRPAEKEYEVTVTARAIRQHIESSVELQLWLTETPLDAEIFTDRRIYEPGQTVYLRGLWRDEAWLPADGLPVRLTIFGPDHQALEHLEAQTSALGVAAWSWPIPSTAATGTYRVQVHGDTEPKDSELVPDLQFEVLAANPDARLEAHPRQSVVLPGGQAEIEIRARDADGQPWVGAPVEIVEMVIVDKSEADRAPRPLRRLPHADAPGQATLAFGDLEPEGSASPPDGHPLPRTDAEGRLIVTLTDLDSVFRRIRDRWDSYQDLIFEARVHDPQTHRSSASRFELRLSPQAIHLHMAGSVGDKTLPDDAYLFAQHVDGTPASCWVEIRRSGFPEEHRVVGRVKTNALGVASLEGMSLDPHHLYDVVALGEDPDAPVLGSSPMSFAKQKEMRLLIERPLLRSGEDLHMELHVHQPRPHLQAFLWNAEGKLLAHLDDLEVATSQKLTFPYQDTYRGVLTVLVVDIAAAREYVDPHRSFEAQPSTSRAVVYPGQPGPRLDISIHPSPAGDTAQLTLEVEEARGSAVAALAVSQPSIASLGSSDSASAWKNHGPQDLELGGWNLQRLLQLPEETRYHDAAQHVARGLLGDGYYVTQVSQTSHLMPHQRAARRPQSSRAARRAKPSQAEPKPEGRLIGLIADLSGGVIPSIPITVTGGRRQWTTVSDDEGFYEMSLPAGKYLVQIDLEAKAGITLHGEVWVVSGRSTSRPFYFVPGGYGPTTFGFSSPNQYRAETASIPPLDNALWPSGATSNPTVPTLFWLPDAPLDAKSQLTVDIPVPPGGTRWHVTALASDASGRITTAETEWLVESKP